LIRLADQNAVPGGTALAVDRDRFAQAVTEALEGDPRIEIRREEFRGLTERSLDPAGRGSATLIATGPLTSDTLARELESLTGSEHLSFYDAISPIVDAETLNMPRLFRAARYGKAGADYLNAPITD